MISDMNRGNERDEHICNSSWMYGDALEAYDLQRPTTRHAAHQ